MEVSIYQDKLIQQLLDRVTADVDGADGASRAEAGRMDQIWNNLSH